MQCCHTSKGLMIMVIIIFGALFSNSGMALSFGNEFDWIITLANIVGNFVNVLNIILIIGVILIGITFWAVNDGISSIVDNMITQHGILKTGNNLNFSH